MIAMVLERASRSLVCTHQNRLKKHLQVCYQSHPNQTFLLNCFVLTKTGTVTQFIIFV